MNSITADIITPTIVIAISCFTISYHATKSASISFICTLIKSSVFYIYFNYFFDGTYTFEDDINYLKGGALLLSRDVDLFNLFEEWDYLRMIGGGNHFGYYLYNSLSFRLFSEHYFAPVALNIILTCITAWVGSKLAGNLFKFDRNQYNLFYSFLLLHPDILSWSSICNMKDILVLLMHVLLLYAGYFFLSGETKKSFMLAIPVALILSTVRFYVAAIFAIAICISIFYSKKGNSKIMYFVLGFILLIGTYFLVGRDMFDYAGDELGGSKSNLLFGVTRVILTPIPFRTEASYAFLNFSALFHWCMIPFAVYGVIIFFKRRDSFDVFLLAYFTIFIFLYGIYEELQGPRHRVQLDYAIALFQFIGIRTLLFTKKTINDR